MKKLLSLIGAFAIAASSTVSVVSCSYNSDLEDEYSNMINFYARVAEEAVKPAILLDQTFYWNNNKDDKFSLDPNFTNSIFANKSILDSIPEAFENAPDLVKPSKTQKVKVLYNTLFNNYKYNITNEMKNIDNIDGFDEGSNLEKYARDSSSIHTKKPDSALSETLKPVASGLNIALGNDFTPAFGHTVVGALKAPSIGGLLKSAKDIIYSVNDAISANKDSIDSILKALTQEEVTSTATMSDVLTDSTQKLFKSLIYFVSGQTLKFNDESKNLASAVFFSHLLKNDWSEDDDLISVKENEKTGDLMDSVANILFFANTLFHYIEGFDTFKADSPIIDGNYLFSNQYSNQEVANQVLSKNYRSNIYDWYSEGDSQYALINLKNIASDIQMYLSPDKKDKKGYNTLKFINILFGATGENLNKPEANPIVESLINNGLMSGIKSVVGSDDDNINSLIDVLGNNIVELLNWFATDGGSNSAIKTLIKNLSGVINNLSESLISDIAGLIGGDSVKQIINIVKYITGYLAGTDGQKLLDHPWHEMYNGNFIKDIADVLYKLNPKDENIKNLRKIKNIKELLNSNITNVANVFSLAFTGNTFEMPDSLYSFKDLSIAELGNYLAEQMKTSRYEKPADGNTKDDQYLINTFDIKTLINSLIPTYTGIVDENNRPVGLLEVLYESIISIVENGGKSEHIYKATKPGMTVKDPNNDGKDKDVKDFVLNPNGIFDSNNALEIILGLQGQTNASKGESFIKGSLLYSVSRLYGHNYINEDTKFKQNPWMVSNKENTVSIMAHTPKQLLGVVLDFANLTGDSITNLVKDKYDKYVKPSNFTLSNIEPYGLDVNYPDGDYQKLSFSVSYSNPDTKQTTKYNIKMRRWINPASVVQNSPWEITNINK